MNGAPTNVHFLDLDRAESMSTETALGKLEEKLDDIRASQTVFAVEQARTTAMVTGLTQQVGDVNALRSQVATLTEKVRTIEVDKIWLRVEQILTAAIGGGLALGAQYFLKS
jgi:phage I-like protein